MHGQRLPLFSAGTLPTGNDLSFLYHFLLGECGMEENPEKTAARSLIQAVQTNCAEFMFYSTTFETVLVLTRREDGLSVECALGFPAPELSEPLVERSKTLRELARKAQTAARN